jgi:hypothetical protein
MQPGKKILTDTPNLILTRILQQAFESTPVLSGRLI